jgi:hypothetical protein
MKIGVTGGARLRRVRYKKMPVAGKKRSNSVNLRAGRNAAPGDRGRWPRPVGRDSVEPKHSPAPIRCSMFAYSQGSTPAPGVAGRALASSPLRGPPRSLEFFRVRISREGAGNSTRGGRAPPFQPFFVGRVPSHGIPGCVLGVPPFQLFSMSVCQHLALCFSISAFQCFSFLKCFSVSAF